MALAGHCWRLVRASVGMCCINSLPDQQHLALAGHYRWQTFGLQT
jgi:hypothetical protein